MKCKKLLSLILALAMVLSLAVPAFADNTATATTQNVAITGSTTSGAVNITVPAAGAVMLNPYQLKVTVSGVSSYHQIYSAPVACKNKSTFALSVDAVVVGTPTTGVSLVGAAPALTVTEKQVFLYAEFGVNESGTVQPTWQTTYNAKNANQVLAAATPGTTKAGVASLPATDGTDSGANYLWYKFDGAATKKPETAWATSDKVDASIALTLKSVVSDVYAITVTNTQTATAKGTATLNYDVAPAGETITLTCAADSTTSSATPTVTIKGVAAADINTETAGEWTFTMPAAAVTITVKWA